MKPTKLETIDIDPVGIGLFEITKLEIDLMHVNYGMDSKGKYNSKPRSNYTKEEVAAFFRQLDGFFLEPEAENGDYLYFAAEIEIEEEKKFLISFCINPNAPECAGVITLYQIKKTKKKGK